MIKTVARNIGDTSMQKMTKKDYFLSIRAQLTDASEIAFIDHELELLERKNSKRKTELTETQKENLAYKEQIMDFLKQENRKVTISEIGKYMKLSSQRVTPIMNKLANENRVTVTVEKRIRYFEVA